LQTLDDLRREHQNYLDTELSLSALNGMIGIVCYLFKNNNNMTQNQRKELEETKSLLYLERHMLYGGDKDIRAKCLNEYAPMVKRFFKNLMLDKDDSGDTV
jgi:hypothetical protein